MGINCNTEYEDIVIKIRPEDKAVLILAALATRKEELPAIPAVPATETTPEIPEIPADPAIPAISLEQFITELIEVAAANYRHDHTPCHCQGPEPCVVPEEDDTEDEL